MLPHSWAGVPADSAAAYYASLPPERTAYYVARWTEASQQNPGEEGHKFRWHLAILERLTGLPETTPKLGAQYSLF